MDIPHFQKAPVILGGCPRSGTTFLLSILSALPGVYAIAEEAWAFYDCETMDEFATYVDRWLWPKIPAEAPQVYNRWIEKTPRNIFAFEKILEYFDNEVSLIIIVRDGRDVILSRHPHEPSKYWVDGWLWKWSAQEALRWRNDPRVLQVSYEGLIGNFDHEINRICEFLGEPCVLNERNWVPRATVRKHLAWFENVKASSAASIGRWRQHADEPRIREFLADVEVVRLLDELGYQ